MGCTFCLSLRIQELNDLCDLSPDWDGLRRDVISHCSQLIGWYKETLSELNRLKGSSSFKSSQRKADRHVQFVPTNLHLQRMEVIPGEGSRARALLASMAKLQPLIFGLSEEVLTSSLELSPTRLQQALDRLAYQTEQFVHALKDELVRSTLLAIHALSPAPSRGPTPVTMGNGVLSNHTSANQEGLPPGCTEYDEEDWTSAAALRQQLQGVDASYPGGSRQDQLLPLVVTLRECVREASQKARAAMSVVLLQEALASSHHHTPLLTHRRDAVFSQALVVLVCGVVLRVYESVNQPEVLLQFHTAGVLVQFEALLSTYGEEVGMLEDMEVGVSDLSRVAFCVTAATSDHPDHLLPTLRGTRGSLVVELRFPAETFGSLPQELQAGGLIRVHPVLFNIGINQNQSLAERSHLSWGQMVACYARPWCSVPRVGPWVGAPAVGPQAPGCHLYPVIFLLVISHLLVLWLIISLLIALDYQ
ncbi:unnamed protein product [Merluccius merluccius]